MLYLAQAHYAGAHEGAKLMPATFLATELGPLLVFFFVNARFNLFAATGAFMVAVVAAIAVSYVVTRHVPIMAIVTVLIAVYGHATMAAANKWMIPTSGLILIVGAAGTGKSSTMAAMIDHRNRTRSGHILTIEDPIEYQLKGVNQIQVSEKSGLTFARGLRSILEQSLIDTMFDLPNATNVDKVVVDESTIVDNQPPLLVYREAAKKA